MCFLNGKLQHKHSAFILICKVRGHLAFMDTQGVAHISMTGIMTGMTSIISLGS